MLLLMLLQTLPGRLSRRAVNRPSVMLHQCLMPILEHYPVTLVLVPGGCAQFEHSIIEVDLEGTRRAKLGPRVGGQSDTLGTVMGATARGEEIIGKDGTPIG